MKFIAKQQYDIVITAEENKEIRILQYVLDRLNNVMARVRQTMAVDGYEVKTVTPFEIGSIIEDEFGGIQVELDNEAGPHELMIANFENVIPEDLKGNINEFKLWIGIEKDTDEGKELYYLLDLNYQLDEMDSEDRVADYTNATPKDIAQVYQDAVQRQIQRTFALYA